MPLPNGDVDTVNVLAQHRRREAGELGPDSIQSPDRDYAIHPGDRLILRGAPLRLETGERIENGILGAHPRANEQRPRPEGQIVLPHDESRSRTVLRVPLPELLVDAS
jgi:hypothetical protein